VHSRGWPVPSCDLWRFGLEEKIWFAFSWSEKCSSIPRKNTLDTMYTCYRTCLQCSHRAPRPLTQPQINHHKYVLVVIWTCGETATKITTSICGDLDFWRKPPQKTPHQVKNTLSGVALSPRGLPREKTAAGAI